MQAWYIYIYKKDGFQIIISLKRGIRKDTNTMKRSNCLGFFWWRIFEVHAQEKEGAVSILIWVQTKHEWGWQTLKVIFAPHWHHSTHLLLLPVPRQNPTYYTLSLNSSLHMCMSIYVYASVFLIYLDHHHDHHLQYHSYLVT